MDRRNDCLRRLVTVLCDRNDVTTLCAFPFIGLEEEIEATLEFKARNSHVSSQANYYKILYSFYLSRMNFRKGKRKSNTTFYGFRSSHEPSSSSSSLYVLIYILGMFH
jgi:hypothetical protein